ncbi:hypothetical protein [Suttonella ornithocola]|uniref:Uncharacterized protein n=1 Tax=Suttonella ornithocola TaxID=279832 RepID=A0A380MUK4_9GAMM|nr:hypothetical protein [Suttonella ornithocola]SUO96280.1 Uncharacterised protein [Suttonella ornithocola]
MRNKKLLYRKVNTRTFNVRHDFGGEFKNERHAKREHLTTSKGKMYCKKQRGLDYTPLYHFLLSKVGQKWDIIFSEAKSRLDRVEPIFHIVALNSLDKHDVVRVGESSYFSGLFVDEQGILQLCNPNLTAKDLSLFCNCCTHTLNGKIFESK